MKILWMITLVLVCLNANAHTHLSVAVTVIDPTHHSLRLLGKNPELVIDHVNQLGYEVYGPAGLPNYLKKNSIVFVAQKATSITLASDYPTPEATLQNLKNLGNKYSSLIALVEIGKSVEGRALTFARVTAPAGQGKPLNDRAEFKFIANMHGDEIAGRELMMKLISDLASNYGKEQKITDLLNTVQIYILPSMNPDGAAHQVRYNAHGTDLNRAFPDFTTSDTVNTPDAREPEIQAVMKFQAAHHFKLSANFHGGAEVVNYPWDAQPGAFPLENLVKKISLDYSQKVPYIYASSQFPQGITNGYAWYEVKGGMQDWSYHWHNDIQITIELTSTKWPKFSSIEQTYKYNREALLGFIQDISLTP